MKVGFIIILVSYLVYTNNRRSFDKVAPLVVRSVKKESYKEYFNRIKRRRKLNIQNGNCSKEWWLRLLLISCGDVEANPGPSCPHCNQYFNRESRLKKHLDTRKNNSCDLESCWRKIIELIIILVKDLQTLI